MTAVMKVNDITINHIDGEDRICVYSIADGTDNDLHSVYSLVEKYTNEFSEFGSLPKISLKENFIISNGGDKKLVKVKQTYMLNEQQATLLLTFLKNSEIIVRFKVSLIKAFYELKNNRGSSFTLPKTYKDALKELVLKVEEIEALENKIEEQKPLVTYAETVSTAVNGVTLREWVGMMKQENGLKVGEQKVINFLIDQKYLYRNGSGKLIPYANRFDYFSTEPIIIATPKGNKEFPSLKITGKGQVSLVEKVVKHFL